MPIFGRLRRKLVPGLFLAVVNSFGKKVTSCRRLQTRARSYLSSRPCLGVVKTIGRGCFLPLLRALELASDLVPGGPWSWPVPTLHFALPWPLQCLHCSSDPCNASTQLVNSFWCQQLRNSMPACSQPATENSVLTPKEAFAPYIWGGQIDR